LKGDFGGDASGKGEVAEPIRMKIVRSPLSKRETGLKSGIVENSHIFSVF